MLCACVCLECVCERCVCVCFEVYVWRGVGSVVWECGRVCGVFVFSVRAL